MNKDYVSLDYQIVDLNLKSNSTKRRDILDSSER